MENNVGVGAAPDPDCRGCLVSQEQVTLGAVPFDPRAARDLLRIRSLVLSDVNDFQVLVGSGNAQILGVFFEGRRIGTVIWSLEADIEGVAVIVKALGAEPVLEVSITSEVHRLFSVLAAAAGAYAIRIWTQREGLRRSLGRLGYAKTYVMEHRFG